MVEYRVLMEELLMARMLFEKMINRYKMMALSFGLDNVQAN
jgi:hypothetical protein